VWFQLVILSIVALFTIITWDRSSYIDLLMFYSLACLSFFRYRFHGFRSLSMYFLIDYYRFRNYRNIGAVFVSDFVFEKKMWKRKWFSLLSIVSYHFHPYSSLFCHADTRNLFGTEADADTNTAIYTRRHAHEGHV
jgi:hypothetical protein